MICPNCRSSIQNGAEYLPPLAIPDPPVIPSYLSPARQQSLEREYQRLAEDGRCCYCARKVETS